MLICPKCQRIYDDSWRICVSDGTTLILSEDTSKETPKIKAPQQKFDIKTLINPISPVMLFLALVVLFWDYPIGSRPDTMARLFEDLNPDFVVFMWLAQNSIPLWLWIGLYAVKWLFFGYLLSLIPFIKRYQLVTACIIFLLGLYFIHTVYTDKFGKWAELKEFKRVVKKGEIRKGKINSFREYKNIRNKNLNRYISLQYEWEEYKYIPREETWSINAPTYKPGDIIYTMHLKGMGYNQSSPNGTTLHNIKIQPLLAKYRSELINKKPSLDESPD